MFRRVPARGAAASLSKSSFCPTRARDRWRPPLTSDVHTAHRSCPSKTCHDGARARVLRVYASACDDEMSAQRGCSARVARALRIMFPFDPVWTPRCALRRRARPETCAPRESVPPVPRDDRVPAAASPRTSLRKRIFTSHQHLIHTPAVASHRDKCRAVQLDPRSSDAALVLSRVEAARIRCRLRREAPPR